MGFDFDFLNDLIVQLLVVLSHQIRILALVRLIVVVEQLLELEKVLVLLLRLYSRFLLLLLLHLSHVVLLVFQQELLQVISTYLHVVPYLTALIFALQLPIRLQVLL